MYDSGKQNLTGVNVDVDRGQYEVVLNSRESRCSRAVTGGVRFEAILRRGPQ